MSTSKDQPAKPGKSSKIDDLLSKSKLGQSGQRPTSLMYRTGANARALTGAFSVGIESLLTNPNQVRRTYNEESLEELAADIKVRGIIEPLIVRPAPQGGGGNYEIVAGERRYRAAKKAGLSEIPVLIRELDDQEMRFVMLVENIQREELSPSDEKTFFEQLQGEFNLSIIEIAKLINKSTAYVSRRLNSAMQSIISEKGNDTYASYDLREKSQITNETKPAPQSQKAPLSKTKFSVSGVQKFATTLETAREFYSKPEAKPDAKTRLQLKETLNDLKEKIAQLEATLDEKEKA